MVNNDENIKLGGKNMKNTVIKLTILSIILLVSISGTVLGYTNYATNGAANSTTSGVSNGTTGGAANGTTNGVANDTGVSTAINTSDAKVTSTVVQATVTYTQGKVATTTEQTEPTYQKETGDQNKPVRTPKSPGLGPVVSIMILLGAVYISRRN